MIGRNPERALDVKDREVGGQREEGGAGRFVWVEMAGVRDVGHVARGAEGVHRLLDGPLRSGPSADREELPRAIDPAQRVALPVEVILRMVQRQAHEVVRGRVALIDEEVINREPPLLDHRAHLGEAGILVPPAALMEIREHEQHREEEDEFETREAGHGENDE